MLLNLSTVEFHKWLFYLYLLSSVSISQELTVLFSFPVHYCNYFFPIGHLCQYQQICHKVPPAFFPVPFLKSIQTTEN